jgi:hypothetical protein
MLPRRILTIFCLLVSFAGALTSTHHAFGQPLPDTTTAYRYNRDSTALPVINTGNTTVTVDHIAVSDGKFQPDPKRSGLYSALVPGLGQLYNRQYWKVPVIYAGLAVAGYFFMDNLTNYQSYRKAYIGRINNQYPTDKYVGIYSPEQLQQLQNDYNRYLNLTVLFTTVGYTLQVIEAITGAHLKNFDISRDISLQVAPAFRQSTAGMALVINFK